MVKERMVWLDIIRILAIALIVWFHFAYELSLDNSIRWIGFIGASLFFIASGYALAKAYPALESFDLNWFRKRWIRVASLYYPALILIALLFADQAYQGDWLTKAGDLISHFLFINFLWPQFQWTLISPCWFIVPLMTFYLLYPYLNRFTKSYWWFLPLMIAVAALFRIKDGTWTSFYAVFFAGEFCFGILLGHGRKDMVLASCLIMAVVQPVMALPFIIFFLSESIASLRLPFNSIPLNHQISSAIGFLGGMTFAVFLFHEALFRTFVGRWRIQELDKAQSFIVTLVCVMILMGLADLINKRFADGKIGRGAIKDDQAGKITGRGGQKGI